MATCPRPARCTLRPTSSPQPTRLTSAPPQRALFPEYSWSTGYDDDGVVHINHVVAWTANQRGLVTLTFDLLTLKVVSESRVTWATSMPILVFLGLSILDLGPMYARDVRQTSDKNIVLMPPPIRGGGITRRNWNKKIRWHSGETTSTTISVQNIYN